MTAWLIRGGRHGERERFALDRGVASAGWSKVGDLAKFTDRTQVSAELVRGYPGSNKARIANWTGQLWRFVSGMQVGDYVVMPLKNRREIAVGLITGSYIYVPTAQAESHHQRPVRWRSTNVPRSEVQQDLLDSMGAAMTICELSRFDAAARIERVFKDGIDQGDPARKQDAVGIADAQQLMTKAASQDAVDPLKLTIRELLHAWDATRRTVEVVTKIEEDLATEGFTTNPPFTEGWIDNHIALVAVGVEPDPDAAEPEPEPDAVDISEFPETTHRIDALRAANSDVARVSLNDSIRTATTHMLLKGYSQLAVIDDHGNLCGCVTWESIARSFQHGSDARVAVALVRTRPVQGHEELLGLIREISNHGYVFVVDSDGALKGIVTAADLAGQFGSQMQPFVLLEEIERRLRRRTNARFTLEDFRTFGKELRRKPKSADEFTFGTYQHFFKDKGCFKHLGWPLDHQVFLEELNRARETRNELMHFALDDVDPGKLKQLNGLLNLIRGFDK